MSLKTQQMEALTMLCEESQILKFPIGPLAHIGYFTRSVDVILTAADKAAIIDPYSLEACDYRITWTWIMNGYIWRRCKNAGDDSFTKVSYFRGSTTWGLSFWNLDESVKFGYTSRSSFWWNRNREVLVEFPAPFPPVIPSLCSACYDSIRRS
ncbi:3200_t:CDS:2, partial [Acaulospora colombiana]